NSNQKSNKKKQKTNVTKGKKQKSDEKQSVDADKIVKIQMPSTLKKQLVDDWEFVTQKDQLVKLPCSPNVDDVLKKYLEYRTRKDCKMTDSIAEILNGLHCYFDKALPLMLLYKNERQQYHDVVTSNISPSIVYGAKHLLRLFVKLPELLAYVNIEEETKTCLQQKLVDFLIFLQKNQSTFFVSVYDGSKAAMGTIKSEDNKS
ncbi:protein MRG1-like, partial [Amaranthus tricolor]|uniref:protein MRG1-like n=1 Tax=Amaranthus tricolor TaxID=29722 RepID=UPI0025908C86